MPVVVPKSERKLIMEMRKSISHFMRGRQLRGSLGSSVGCGTRTVRPSLAVLRSDEPLECEWESLR